MIKNLPAMQETQVLSPHGKDPQEKGKATHSNVLVWRIPRTEVSCGLQSMGYTPFLCLLSREDPLAFVGQLVLWW